MFSTCCGACAIRIARRGVRFARRPGALVAQWAMRDRDAWTAIMTLAAAEYVVATELGRLGLRPYLAQRKSRWLPKGATRPMPRSTPLFPRYLFLPVAEARLPQLHYVRGLPGHRYLLTSAEGVIWTAGADVIFEVARLENEGAFDAVDVLPGEKVRLRGTSSLSNLDLLVATAGEKMVELLSPLFGGVRASARASGPGQGRLIWPHGWILRG